ncbi:MAG: DUF89 family protein [Candidatus Thermoplasmatota archaeon]|nr:DUF89 family protein [Candidatus Thermoplasmatota archaeon]
MQTHLDCIPCFLHQSLEAARMATRDEKKHEEVMKQVMKHLETIDFTHSPPEISQHVHHIIRNVTENTDPYIKVKKEANQHAKDQYPTLKKMVEQSNDPLLMAAKLAIIGNVIDFGTMNRMNVKDMIDNIAHKPFDDSGYQRFKQKVKDAKTIVYLADNTGEIFFDKLLLEQLQDENRHIIYVVKQYPIINDATKDDALYAGIDAYADIIAGDKDATYSAPGLVLSNMSKELQRLLKEADVVISKGQGNYESLSESDREIFFLLMVKCPLVANNIAIDQGTMVLKVKS